MPVVIATPDVPASNIDSIEIGLVNNLGDAGFESGERQIFDLLSDVADSRPVRLHLYTLPSIVRGAGLEERLSTYGDLAKLQNSRLDGLFVTGCEPRCDRLRDEAFWAELTDVIDWAAHNTRSAIWSCLSAHAAVQHLDGIERHRLPEKCSGVFQVQRVSEDRLLDGAADALQVCHSRYNDLSAEDLVDAGYEILTSSPSVGVDSCIRRGRSLFLFLQGHPEYDADALRREYRRDVMRFLDGSTDSYPHMPKDYFSRALESSLSAFAAQAKLQPDADLACVFPLNGRKRGAGPAWNRDFATILFRNWLDEIEAKATDRAA